MSYLSLYKVTITLGSPWTRHIVKQFVSDYLGQAIFVKQCGRTSGGQVTSVYLKMNLTSFLGWRFKLRTLAGWRYGSQHSIVYHPSLGIHWGRFLILFPLP